MGEVMITVQLRGVTEAQATALKDAIAKVNFPGELVAYSVNYSATI